jgi:nucleotide-binding universal stress UspA family protein
MEPNRAPVVVGIRDMQPTALRFALREAHRRGTGLRVIHSSGLRDDGQELLDDARHVIEQEVTPVPVAYELTSVAPIEALEAEAHEAAIVVIGADGISWPDRLLGGAIASHVANHAACPVVMVPEPDHSTTPGEVVVIALDGDTPARGPLHFAFEQADARALALHVLHAVPPATAAPDAECLRADIGEALAGWADTFPEVRVLLSFPIDEADDACRRATERSELVVVGRPHRHSLPFALARPLAAGVVRHARCPVAVVPAEYRGA